MCFSPGLLPAPVAHRRPSSENRPSAVVCVIYEQSDEEVERFLRALGELSGPPCPVWLVVSKPGRDLAVPSTSARVIELSENVGWTGGANAGARAARAAGCRDIVFMNTDVEFLSSDILVELSRAMDSDPGLGFVSPGIVSSARIDRIWYRGAIVLPWAWVTRHPGIGQVYRPSGRVIPTEVPSGCCMVMRGQLFDELGGFDERLFAYFDEADLAWRAARAGWRAGLVDLPLLAHDHRGRELGEISAYYFGRNPFILARTHCGPLSRVIAAAAQCAAAPFYLVRCEGMRARAAYLRGLRDGFAHLLGWTRTERGHR
jgi:GT2 family glycosyltransferase